MTRRFCLILLSGAAAAEIAKPRIGYFVDRKNCLRSVDGVAGSFTIGPVLDWDVISAAFSGTTLVTKKQNILRVGERTFDAPEGPAEVEFDGKGEVSEVFFPFAQLLWTWQNGEFKPAPAHDLIKDIYVSGNHLIVRGVPLRIPREVWSVSQLGEGWLVIYCSDRIYVLRDKQFFELPANDAE
jgi:hypothetical protein